MSSSRDVSPAAMLRCSGNGPHGFGAGRPWPVDTARRAQRSGCRGRHCGRPRPRADPTAAWARPRSRMRPGCQRHRSGHRQGPTSVEADGLAGLEEGALLLDRQRGEPEVAQPVGEVHDGVAVEHHGVVAGRQLDRVAHGGRALGRLATDGGGVDAVDVHGHLLGIAGAAAGTHHHRQHLRPRARLAVTAMPRELATLTCSLGGRGVAEGLRTDAAGGRDDGTGGIGPRVGVGRGGGLGIGSGDERRGLVVRASEAKSDSLGLESRRGAGRCRRGGAGDPSSWRLAEATPTRWPSTKRRFTTVSASATFWWISLLAKRVRALCSWVTTASAWVAPASMAMATARCASSRPLGGCSLRHALPTPTSTSRKRAPLLPWPTCMPCPGWPLPQLVTPTSCQLRSSATASQEPQNRGVMPV